MTEATRYFRPMEQKLHRRFAVDTCLRVHRMGPRADERLPVPVKSILRSTRGALWTVSMVPKIRSGES